MMKKVSLITPTYNGLKVLRQCVESVRRYCGNVDWEWIIGENGSTDGSLEYLKALKDPRIVIVERKNEGNFSSMNNDLAKLARGKYLLFLNNDTEAKGNFLGEMVEFIERDPEIGALGANLYYPDGRLQHCGIAVNDDWSPVNINAALYHAKPFLNKDTHNEYREYQAVTGACLMVPKTDFDLVWGFDPIFNWAYEDVDLCYKIKYHLGKKVVGCKAATLTHHESVSGARPDLNENLARLRNRWGSVVEPDLHTFYKQHANLYANQPKVTDITFVVCTNDLITLNECTISSLKRNANNFALAIVYNMDNRYSAAQALNIGIERARTEYVACAHHDVIFNPNWTTQFVREVAKHPNFGIAGLAGVKRLTRRSHDSLIVDGSIPINCLGEVYYPYKGNPNHKYGQYSEGIVDVLDELCLIVKKSQPFRFDELTLTHFHFYGPDICLQALEKGYTNVVLNCPVYHKSDGESSLRKGMDLYWREFRKIHKKWMKRFPQVVTTTGFWNGQKVKSFVEDSSPPPPPPTEGAVEFYPQQSIELNMGVRQRFSVPLRDISHSVVWFLNGANTGCIEKEFWFTADTKGLQKIEAKVLTGRKTYTHSWMVYVKIPDTADTVQGISQLLRSHTFGELYSNKRIAQEFLSDENNLCRIDLFISTFKRRNDCTLELAVKLNGEIVRISEASCRDQSDMEWVSFPFFALPDSKGKRYTLELKCEDGMPGNAVTVYFVNHNFNYGKLYYNGRHINGCLSFKLFHGLK